MSAQHDNVAQSYDTKPVKFCANAAIRIRDGTIHIERLVRAANQNVARSVQIIREMMNSETIGRHIV